MNLIYIHYQYVEGLWKDHWETCYFRASFDFQVAFDNSENDFSYRACSWCQIEFKPPPLGTLMDLGT